MIPLGGRQRNSFRAKGFCLDRWVEYHVQGWRQYRCQLFPSFHSQLLGIYPHFCTYSGVELVQYLWKISSTDLFLQFALFGPPLHQTRLSSHHIWPQKLLICFTAVITKLSGQFSAFGCCRSSPLRFCVPKTKNYKSKPIVEYHLSDTAFLAVKLRLRNYSPLLPLQNNEVIKRTRSHDEQAIVWTRNSCSSGNRDRTAAVFTSALEDQTKLVLSGECGKIALVPITWVVTNSGTFHIEWPGFWYHHSRLIRSYLLFSW